MLTRTPRFRSRAQKPPASASPPQTFISTCVCKQDQLPSRCSCVQCGRVQSERNCTMFATGGGGPPWALGSRVSGAVGVADAPRLPSEPRRAKLPPPNNVSFSDALSSYLAAYFKINPFFSTCSPSEANSVPGLKLKKNRTFGDQLVCEYEFNFCLVCLCLTMIKVCFSVEYWCSH